MKTYKIFSISGRATRREFWCYFILSLMVTSAFLNVMFNAISVVSFYTGGIIGYGCFLLGNFFWDGFGVETQDNWKAAELYEKACQLNNSSGCIELGRLYEHKKLHLFSRTEQVFSMDSEMAAKLYKKACTLGNDVGCSLANSVHD